MKLKKFYYRCDWANSEGTGEIILRRKKCVGVGGKKWDCATKSCNKKYKLVEVEK